MRKVANSLARLKWNRMDGRSLFKETNLDEIHARASEIEEERGDKGRGTHGAAFQTAWSEMWGEENQEEWDAKAGLSILSE